MRAVDPAHLPDMLTSGQVARMFGVSYTTVHRWVARGLLPGMRTLGGELRFKKADVLKLKETHDA